MHQNFTEANESHFSQNIGVLHSEKRASCNKSVDILQQLVTTSRPVKLTTCNKSVAILAVYNRQFAC